MVTLGAGAGGALTVPEVSVVWSDEASLADAEGGVVVVVVGAVVVGVVVGVIGAAPVCRRSPRRGEMREAAVAGSPSRCGAGGVLPAVATSSAIRPSETARMTHQLGRP